MTLEEARKTAAAYPETSGIGGAVAAFAEGHRVSYERFMSDLDMLATEYGFDSHDDIAALRQFAGDTAADIWRD